MRRIFYLLVIVIAGGAVICPIIMAIAPDPLPLDFTIVWKGEHLAIPVLWSLCASACLTLLYSLMRR